MKQFDPNAAATNDSGVFGLPFEEADSALIYLPIPWEVTTSYGGGTSHGPSAILSASHQVDLFDLDVSRPYEPGLFMLPESQEVLKWSEDGKAHAQKIIECAGQIEGNADLEKSLDYVNRLGDRLNQYVFENTKKILQNRRLPGIVGGDHSVPYGAFRAIAENNSSFGILHFDAHSDTRKAYEGFQWSHASIMYNALETVPQISKLTQVGIRDICEEEVDYLTSQKDRASVFYDRDLQNRKFKGESWATICKSIVDTLPGLVWISFDIDGLDPRYCPHTGTPVPGGLDFQEANFLIGEVVRSGRKIIGFDLNEVSPHLDNPNDEWDANVGARLLYKLSAWTLASQGLAKIK